MARMTIYIPKELRDKMREYKKPWSKIACESFQKEIDSTPLLDIPIGIYKIYWKSGGSSVASIYMDADGTKWLAPSNWVAPGRLSPQLPSIKRYKKLD